MKRLPTGCFAVHWTLSHDVMYFLEELEGSHFHFSSQPVALSADLRPLWRLTLLLLILHRCCRQSRSSLKKLHVLNWALRQPESRRVFLSVIKGSVRPDDAIVRFDPALNRALDLARGEKLIDQVSVDRYQITPKGQRFAEEVFEDPECMKIEKWFLDEVAGQVTETAITKLLEAN